MSYLFFFFSIFFCLLNATNIRGFLFCTFFLLFSVYKRWLFSDCCCLQLFKVHFYHVLFSLFLTAGPSFFFFLPPGLYIFFFSGASLFVFSFLLAYIFFSFSLFKFRSFLFLFDSSFCFYLVALLFCLSKWMVWHRETKQTCAVATAFFPSRCKRAIVNPSLSE